MKYIPHTLRKKFIHKDVEIECIFTQALIDSYLDHGHYHVAFINVKTGDLISTRQSMGAPPEIHESLDEIISDFIKNEYNLIDDLKK